MTPEALTIEALRTFANEHHACLEARRWLRSQADPRSAWQACPRSDWMLWLVEELLIEPLLLLRLAVAAAREVAPYLQSESLASTTIEQAEAYQADPSAAPLPFDFGRGMMLAAETSHNEPGPSSYRARLAVASFVPGIVTHAQHRETPTTIAKRAALAAQYATYNAIEAMINGRMPIVLAYKTMANLVRNHIPFEAIEARLLGLLAEA